MSKYYWQRGETTVAFIYTARQLSIRIKMSCANANHKKFTFYGLQDLSHYTTDLCRMCFQINRLNPDRRGEADARILLEKKALGLLDEIVSLFGECEELIGFSDGVLQEVSELMDKENRLLTGLLKSDNERQRHIR